MPDTPNTSRVEEVLARIKGVKHNVGTEPRTYYLAEQADLDALIAAVREDTLAQVRERVEALIVPQPSNVYDAGRNAFCKDILAALSDLAEGK